MDWKPTLFLPSNNLLTISTSCRAPVAPASSPVPAPSLFVLFSFSFSLLLMELGSSTTQSLTWIIMIALLNIHVGNIPRRLVIFFVRPCLLLVCLATDKRWRE